MVNMPVQQNHFPVNNFDKELVYIFKQKRIGIVHDMRFYVVKYWMYYNKYYIIKLPICSISIID